MEGSAAEARNARKLFWTISSRVFAMRKAEYLSGANVRQGG
jgi:hypothetical protein